MGHATTVISTSLPWLVTAIAAIASAIWLRVMWVWLQTSRRLETAAEAIQAANEETVASPSDRGPLARYLYRAGFRGGSATTWFWAAMFAAVLAGSMVAMAVMATGVVDLASTLLRALPGAVGEVFLPMVWISPILAVLVVGLSPILIVRGMVRKRVRMIEQDMPLALDLLATLAEAGLSFDAALQRVLQHQQPGRPLAQEFSKFLREIQVGRGRIESLRRLRDNVSVPWFSIFISSLVHAEQVGASLSATLRSQAEDLRSRRRERALAAAMAIGVKLLFPLVICFLPGILIASLGPILFQVVQLIDQFLQGGF